MIDSALVKASTIGVAPSMSLVSAAMLLRYVFQLSKSSLASMTTSLSGPNANRFLTGGTSQPNAPGHQVTEAEPKAEEVE